jgi:hypothetical protein
MSYGPPSVTGPSSSRPDSAAHPAAHPAAPVPGAEPVIELGDREPAVEAAPTPRLGRATGAALIMLLTLITVSAAAPRAPGVIEVGTIGGRVTAVALQPDTAVVASADAADGATTIQRYALDGDRAEPGWSTGVSGTVDEITIRDGANGRTVIAFSYSGAGLTALDGTTGAVLWSMTDMNVVQMFDDTVLLLPRPADGADDARPRMVSLRTGATTWTRGARFFTWQFDAGSTLGRQPRHLISVDEDGRVATYRLADFRLVVSADLGFELTHAELDYTRDFTTATVVDGVLYVARLTGGRTSLTAYPILTLRKAWETTGGPTGGPSDCRPYLCIADETSASVLDPADGRVLWTDTRWGYVYGTGSSTELVAVSRDALPESTLVDADTGRILHRLGPGTLLDGPATLFLRSNGIGGSAQVTTVAGGALRVLGDIGTVTTHRCRTAGDYLSCPSVGGPTRIWHLPPR